MPFGHTSASSKVRLNYAAIKQALDEQLNNRRVRDNTFVYAFKPNLKLIRGYGNDVVLRMYATDIVTFHPDGTKTLVAGGYIGSPMTRHWLREACGYQHVYQLRPNVWSPIYSIYWNHGDPVLWYDGMTLDADNVLISERRPMHKLLPNAEAKDLRRKLLAVIREHYLPHLHMLGLDPKWQHKIPETHIHGNIVNHLLKGEFDFNILYGALHSHKFQKGCGTPKLAFMKAVDETYRWAVVNGKMLEHHLYQPKGN